MAAAEKKRRTGRSKTSVLTTLKKKTAGRLPIDDANVLENPLMNKLPPEIRNKIYKLVLINDHDGELEDIKIRLGTYATSEERKRKEHYWREPGLLLTCKAIRQEALSMYYLNNTFLLYINSRDFPRVYEWLKFRKHVSGARIHGIQVAFYVTSGQWSHLPSFFWLAKIAYELDVQGREREGNTIVPHLMGYGVKYEPHHLFTRMPSTPIDRALEEVAKLGTKARLRGLPYPALQIDFEDWMVAKVQSEELRHSWNRRAMTMRVAKKMMEHGAWMETMSRNI